MDLTKKTAAEMRALLLANLRNKEVKAAIAAESIRRMLAHKAAGRDTAALEAALAKYEAKKGA